MQNLHTCDYYIDFSDLYQNQIFKSLLYSLALPWVFFFLSFLNMNIQSIHQNIEAAVTQRQLEQEHQAVVQAAHRDQALVSGQAALQGVLNEISPELSTALGIQLVHDDRANSVFATKAVFDFEEVSFTVFYESAYTHTKQFRLVAALRDSHPQSLSQIPGQTTINTLTVSTIDSHTLLLFIHDTIQSAAKHIQTIEQQAHNKLDAAVRDLSNSQAFAAADDSTLYDGMTLRQYYAGIALGSLILSKFDAVDLAVADRALSFADALIEAIVDAQPR